MNLIKITLLSCAGLTLTGCMESGFEGTRGYRGANDYIAVANDLGFDATNNMEDNAGIAVTPDGCQAWIIDDGIEGRASNRLDPVSGLPVCAGEPGVVYGPYQSGTQGIRDRVPGEALPVRVEDVQVRTVRGEFRRVHPVEQPHPAGYHHH